MTQQILLDNTFKVFVMLFIYSYVENKLTNYNELLINYSTCDREIASMCLQTMEKGI